MRIVVRDEPGSIAGVRSAIEAVASTSGIPRDAVFELKVAANEAVANALAHGRGGTAAVTLAPRGDGVEVEVVGEGPFRSSGGVDPSHGRGLPLIVALADEVEFASEGDRTRVRIRKRAGRRAASDARAA